MRWSHETWLLLLHGTGALQKLLEGISGRRSRCVRLAGSESRGREKATAQHVCQQKQAEEEAVQSLTKWVGDQTP